MTKRISETALRKIAIILNHLPPPQLNPNKLRQLHWSERSKVSLEARQEVGWLAKAQWGNDKPMARARISYEFLIKDRRKRDTDNLLAACKPFTDGLIDAGIILSDDIEHLEYELVRAVYSDKDQTSITITELQE